MRTSLITRIAVRKFTQEAAKHAKSFKLDVGSPYVLFGVIGTIFATSFFLANPYSGPEATTKMTWKNREDVEKL